MIRVSGIAVAALMAMSFGVSGALAQAKFDTLGGPASGQTQPKPNGIGEKTGQMDQTTDKTARRVEGRIKSVTAGGMVTLEDGTKLTIPSSLMIPVAELKPGAVIAAEYEEKGGQKVATSVQIKS